MRRPVRWLRDLPIWTKLGLIMIVPTLATIVIGTAGLLDHVQAANNADRARTLAVLSGDAGRLVHELQNERASAIMLLTAGSTGSDALTSSYRKQQSETESALRDYKFHRSTLADLPANLRALLEHLDSQVSELPDLRTQVVDPKRIPLSTAEARYSVLVSDLLGIRDLSAQLTGDAALTDRMRAAADIATAKEYLSQERVVVLQALASGELPQTVYAAYVGSRKAQELAILQFRTLATTEQGELYDRTMTGPDLRDALGYENALDTLAGQPIPPGLVPADKWDAAMVARSELLNQVEITLNAQAQDAAIRLGEEVQRQVLVETGLLLVTLLLGVLFAWLVARSMARSLRDLRQGALAVAQYGLPQAVARLRDPSLSTQASPAAVALQIADPLPVRSKDEFGQVTEAFNAVHLEAVRTAAEQAALRSSVATMFVNLARRSQILVDRLIGHLDRLERGEQDPDRLSELFQLDHLATRMRRNDENLLVLAGADSTRIQREPAALMDVLRAAQSEVEHYTRLEFGVIDHDIEIAAHAVNDLVHLVAELFDNATAFSPPDSTITVEARRLGDRAVLQVEDRGIGMSPDQYADLNERLATPPMVDVAVSRMMGLVVVARLAARHSVKVELRPAQERGTVADVLLPSGVLVPRALAGRTKAPVGFPASRPPTGPQRPVFPAPLALESGPSLTPAAAGWPSADTGSPYGAPPTGQPPVPAPRLGMPPSLTGSGLGAALAGSDTSRNHARTNGSGGRTMPAWYDLTGAGDGPDPGQPPPLVGGDPLPQRRPAGPWGSDGEAEGAPPRPEGPSAGAATSSSGLPTYPPSMAPPPGAYPEPGSPGGAGGPTASAYPAPHTYPPGLSTSATPTRPPTWPPVAGGDAGHTGSLDMTSELPKVRLDFGPHEAASAASAAPAASTVTDPNPSRYANDLTMELPIFRELESAWFRVEDAEDTSAASAGAGQGGPGGRNGGVDEATTGGPAATPTGSAGAPGGADEVSWRTVADDGWVAASAASEPQDGGTTEIGLPRRVPMAQLVPGGVESAAAGSERRTPEAVRGLLSAYHSGVQRGRSAGGKSPEEPTTESQPSQGGKEQEA